MCNDVKQMLGPPGKSSFGKLLLVPGQRLHPWARRPPFLHHLCMSAALHRGEASCLAVAVRRGMAFLAADARARSAARDLQVFVSGTLGVLLRTVNERLLTLEAANLLLNQMIQAGYRSPYVTLAELLTD